MEGRMKAVEGKLEHIGRKQENMELSMGGLEMEMAAIRKDLQELMRMMGGRARQLDEEQPNWRQRGVSEEEEVRLAYIRMEGSAGYWFRVWKEKAKNRLWEDLKGE
ncbi:uncharacterized protein LOC111241480 [Vigna radiata var. radiata]|uniref:Uncharacterized protein LOC111241480 n=1 Tax=Vigna radiata var. radiata TaxID=3916 RepID=A0A3Q0EWG1_VIGRR|nr:uncharacterized protein LOC111241480 [Vigna radiata var. radiata]